MGRWFHPIVLCVSYQYHIFVLHCARCCLWYAWPLLKQVTQGIGQGIAALEQKKKRPTTFDEFLNRHWKTADNNTATRRRRTTYCPKKRLPHQWVGVNVWPMHPTCTVCPWNLVPNVRNKRWSRWGWNVASSTNSLNLCRTRLGLLWYFEWLLKSPNCSREWYQVVHQAHGAIYVPFECPKNCLWWKTQAMQWVFETICHRWLCTGCHFFSCPTCTPFVCTPLFLATTPPRPVFDWPAVHWRPTVVDDAPPHPTCCNAWRRVHCLCPHNACVLCPVHRHLPCSWVGPVSWCRSWGWGGPTTKRFLYVFSIGRCLTFGLGNVWNLWTILWTGWVANCDRPTVRLVPNRKGHRAPVFCSLRRVFYPRWRRSSVDWCHWVAWWVVAGVVVGCRWRWRERRKIVTVLWSQIWLCRQEETSKNFEDIAWLVLWNKMHHLFWIRTMFIVSWSLHWVFLFDICFTGTLNGEKHGIIEFLGGQFLIGCLKRTLTKTAKIKAHSNW